MNRQLVTQSAQWHPLVASHLVHQFAHLLAEAGLFQDEKDFSKAKIPGFTQIFSL
jgi:hypothetical protein